MKLASLINNLLNRLGFGVHRHPQVESVPTDLPKPFQAIVGKCRKFSLTTHHRLASMIDAVRYVENNRIAGDIVECGVWRGGNIMISAFSLLEIGNTDRDLYLYDTFTGMTPPTVNDKDYSGAEAEVLLQRDPKGTKIWCEASLEDVQANMRSTAYPSERIHFIKGPVEETIPNALPNKIAILRLDTDWYESTKHELVHLYPLLVEGGVLIIDDYGHWQGAQKAVDEYFAEQGIKPLLSRIDYTCRMMIKA
jgi:O-methyltransferase